MLKILFLCPYLPYPLDRGSNIDMWGQIAYLAELGHDIHIVVLHTEAVASSHQSDYEKAANSDFDVTFINTTTRWQLAESIEVVQQFQVLLDAQQADVLWCAYADFAPLVAKADSGDSKIVFRPINFELGHFIDKYGPPNPFDFSRLRMQVFRWRQFLSEQGRTLWQIFQAERTMHRVANALLYIGWRDMEVMQRIYRTKARRLWVPPRLTSSAAPQSKEDALIHVVYLGSYMGNANNLQGGRKFVDEIYPAVRAAFPERFHFHVIGKNSEQYFESSDSLTIHGFIEDLDVFMSQMDIVCVPNVAGWGIKLKVLDSLARGIPVIGAKEAFRGLQPIDDVYFACESIEDYLQAFTVLSDETVRASRAAKSAEYYQDLKQLAESRIQDVLSM